MITVKKRHGVRSDSSPPRTAQTKREDYSPLGGDKEAFSGSTLARLLDEVGMQMQRRLPLGLAVMMGEIDPTLCRELERAAKRMRDYVSWTTWGPMVAVVFRSGLFAELQPFWHQLLAESPGISAGVAFSDGLQNQHELWLAARLALEKAMAKREHLVAYEGEESGRAIHDFRIANLLRRDLCTGGIGLRAHYQPQVKLSTGMPVGAEALARWQMDGGDIPPDRFIPIAEDAGLVGMIGEIMLSRSARTVNVMRRSGIPISFIAVNVSPLQINDRNFLRNALRTVRDEGLDPGDIELEITESLAGEGGAEFGRWLQDIADAGFKLAIDDFGTGSSTLARIREIPAGKIKLDRAFVQPLHVDASGRKLCRMTLDLAHSFGMTSLAEGVETRLQAHFLDLYGCALGQGFFWGRPMPEADLAEWWRCRSGNGRGHRVARTP